MMRPILLIIVILSSFKLGWSQEAEQIYSITDVQKDYAYYNKQASLWEKKLEKSPKNANAWINYFTAARMNNMFAGTEGSRYDLHVIADELKASIPQSFEDHYVTYKLEHDRKAAFPHLKKAYEIDPSRYETWEGFISKAEFDGDYKTMKAFFEKWGQHEMYSPGLSSWNYNALIGLEENAVLITFGDNDTYPLWFLQQAKDIRTDVQVVNASLIFDPTYRARMFKAIGISAFEKTLEELKDYQKFRDELMGHILKHCQRPVYIGISAPQSFRDQYRDQLYIVGLAFKYMEEDFDHVAVIRNNYENLFLKDYMQQNLLNDFSQSVVDYMNQQYIPCLTVLYKHYILSGEAKKAAELERLLLRIGVKGQREAEIKAFLHKYRK